MSDEVKQQLIIDDELIVAYLSEHPDFFIRNARQVEQMHIPHPVKGAVSLVEWQLSRQRQQIHQLEEEITLLIEKAQGNEQLFRQLSRLQSELVGLPSLQSVLAALNQWTKGLGLNSVTLRLFSEQWRLGAPSTFHHLALNRSDFEPIRIQRMGSNETYLGQLNSQEHAVLMPNVQYIGSVAMSLLGDDGELGVIIFNSRNRDHYQYGMGTLLLEQLGQFLPHLITRWIERR